MAKKPKFCFLCLKVHEDKLKCDKNKPCKNCNKGNWLHEKEKEENSREFLQRNKWIGERRH